MRILLTTPYTLWPESSGGARRTLGVARALAALGHDVSLLCCGEPPPPKVLGTIGRACGYLGGGRIGHFFNPRFARALEAALQQGQDMVLAAFPYQAQMLVRACRRHRIALVYDAHNFEAERFANMGNPLVAGLVGVAERHLARYAQAVLAVSDAEQLALQARYHCTVEVLRNGVDADTFVPAAPDQDLVDRLGLRGRRVALFCGSFDYRPNREALARLFEIDWPIRLPGMADTHLLLVGRDLPDDCRGRRGVVVTGEVDDVVPYLRLAHLVLAPLSSGGGTRLKIIEALACGQQVLSTPFGAAGLSGVPIPGLSLCEQALFPQQLRSRLELPIEPGSNDAGHHWARSLSWQTLVAGVDWLRLAGASH